MAFLPGEARAVRSYVTAQDHLQYTQLADGTVQVNVTHSNLKQYVMELRLDLHMTIRRVKEKLYTHNGSTIDKMELHLKDKDGRLVCQRPAPPSPPTGDTAYAPTRPDRIRYGRRKLNFFFSPASTPPGSQARD